MIFNKLPINEEGTQLYERIDDDGKCRLTCTYDYYELQEWIAAGNTPEPFVPND